MSDPEGLSPSGTARDAGFTLLELLVALVLLAMLMLIVPSTLKLASRASTTSAVLMSRADAGAEAAFLRQTLAEAMPLVEPDAEGKLAVAFTGSAGRLDFVAPLASGPAGGGLYRVRLAFETDDGNTSPALLMLFALAPGNAGAAQPLEVRRLAAGLASGVFRYYGTAPGKTEPEWSETWAHGDRLPDMVEITGGADAPLRVELRLRKRN